ncbi:VOC family protein [Mycolicibacterium arenosum]|uniref:hypothetical protein n=1 Tax=Mycolicibacterium arenosum TaxID=2952157 RepID=UPI0038CD4694
MSSTAPCSDGQWNAPDGWTTYLHTADAEATGATTDATNFLPEDTPYGRLAAVADPTGAGFNLSSR